MTNHEMSLVDHLEELRRRLIYSALAFLVATAAAYYFSEEILKFLLRPARPFLESGRGELVFREVGEAFMLQLRIAIYSGLALSTPVLLYQAIAFVLPALEPAEQRLLFIVLPAFVVLFLIGVLFAYFVFLPFTVQFFSTFTIAGLKSLISAGALIEFSLNFVLPFGFLFELPLLIGVLTRLGLITPAFLARNRKYAVLAIFIIAAFLTPPDVISQIMMALPMLALYEGSIWVSRMIKPRERAGASR